MKTGLIPAVVPAPLDAMARTPLPPTHLDAADPAAAGPAVSAAASASAGTTAGDMRSGPQRAAGLPVEPQKARDAGGRKEGAEAMAAQRIALSRLRIEALMLEAQMAAGTGDGERARAVARAVRTEAGNIRQALRASLDAGSAGAASASTEASSAVSRAQAAARKAAAEDRRGGAAEPGLAPWTQAASGAPSPRESAAVENAPAGVPTSNLHRSAYEALRRAEEVLDELARVDWARGVETAVGTARSGLDAAGRTAALGLMNALEAEDGALWSGFNGLA